MRHSYFFVHRSNKYFAAFIHSNANGLKSIPRIWIKTRAEQAPDKAGLGQEKPDGVTEEDDEFEIYRKRMMLAYRFRPNPLVSSNSSVKYDRISFIHSNDP